MGEQHNDYDLALRVGEVTGELKQVVEQLKTTNAGLINLTKKVDSQGKFLDKTKGYGMAVIFVISVIGTFLADWFKSLIHYNK